MFGWATETVGDSDEFRYTMARAADTGEDLAGIMDAPAFLDEGVPAHWSVYFAVDDVDATVATATALGGAETSAPHDTPYGRLAVLADPSGATFKLRATPG